MKTEFCGICDIGKRREKNQDAIFMDAGTDAALFAVADGMGGYLHGEEASGIIIGEMRKWWEEFPKRQQICGAAGDFGKMISALGQRLELANRMIYERYGSGREICGSTAAVLFLYRESYCVLSSGDSRVYYLNSFTWKQLTSDDVWENQPELSQQFSKDEILSHPNRGRLVRAAGVKKEFTCTAQTGILERKMLFALCSDGVYKCMEPEALKEALKLAIKGDGLARPLADMENAVYENQAPDNLSCVLVKVTE